MPRNSWTPVATFVSLMAPAIVAAGSRVAAEPPEIEDIVPAGVRRGEAATLTVRGEGLGGGRLVAPFAFVEGEPGDPSSDDDVLRLRVTVDPEAPVGVFAVRLATEHGPSNPFLLAVDQVPQVAEREDNDRPERAQEVPSPSVIDGQAPGNDVDVFRFSGAAGQRIVVDARCARIGSGLDPTVRLATADGRFVAADDDTPGLRTDARLVATLPEDGDYLVELSDSRYRGSDRPRYRLLIGPVPAAAEVFPMGGRRGRPFAVEARGGTVDGAWVGAVSPRSALEDGDRAWPRLVDPGGPFDIELPHPLILGESPEVLEAPGSGVPAIRVAPPVIVNGRLREEGEEDRIPILVRAGARYRATVEAARWGSAMDGALRVLGPDGDVLERGDDHAIELRDKGRKNAPTVTSLDPVATFEAPDGATEVTLALRDLSRRGGPGYAYRIRVEEAAPTFEVELRTAQVAVPRGGVANVAVNLARRGFEGPVTLSVVDPPPGLEVRDGVVPRGESDGVLSLLADPEAAFDARSLRVVGRAEGPDGPIVIPAEIALAFAELGGVPTNLRVQRGLVAAPSVPGPIVLDAPAGPLTLARGSEVEIPVTASRAEGAGASLTLSPLPMPDGLSAAEVRIAAGEPSGAVTVAAEDDATLGPASVAFVAEGEMNGSERSFAVPAVLVEVVEPRP